MTNTTFSADFLFSTSSLPIELAKRIESRKSSPMNNACGKALEALASVNYAEAFTLAQFVGVVYNATGVLVKDATARNFLNAAKEDGEVTSPSRQTYRLVIDAVQATGEAE